MPDPDYIPRKVTHAQRVLRLERECRDLYRRTSEEFLQTIPPLPAQEVQTLICIVEWWCNAEQAGPNETLAQSEARILREEIGLYEMRDVLTRLAYEMESAEAAVWLERGADGLQKAWDLEVIPEAMDEWAGARRIAIQRYFAGRSLSSKHTDSFPYEAPGRPGIKEIVRDILTEDSKPKTESTTT